MAFFEAGRSLGQKRGAHIRGCRAWKMRSPPKNPPHQSLQERMRLLCFSSWQKVSTDNVGAQKIGGNNQEPLGGEKNYGSLLEFLGF